MGKVDEGIKKMIESTTIHPLPIYYSRSAVVSDWTCPRKRYYGYEYLGRGISPTSTALPLYMGILVHDGIAAITAGLSIDEIVSAGKSQFRAHLLEGHPDDPDAQHFAEEQCALVEGMLRGYAKHIWPRLQEEYEVVACEQEMVYEHDGLHFMAKPDLLLRHKESGDLVYVEFKSTSSVKDKWIGSWNTAVQLHSSIRAVEATLGEPVTQVIVQGLNKGYVSQYDRQESIFCYAYHKAGQPPFQKDTISYIYKAGLKKYPVWQLPGGVKKWVEEMPENLLSQQLPITPPIFINGELVDAFFRQRATREHEIRHGREQIAYAKTNESAQAILDDVFPQYFEECSPGWGDGCQFRKLCHGKKVDPLTIGYSMRVSHHQIEEDQLNGTQE